MFDRIAASRRAQHGDDRGAAPPLAPARRRPGRAGAGRRRPRRLLRHRRPGFSSWPRGWRRTHRGRLATSRSRCSTWPGTKAPHGRHRGSVRVGRRAADAYDGGRSMRSRSASGVRNLPTSPAPARARRVLKPGGGWVILEITQPQRPPLSSFYSLWFDRAVPLLGASPRPRGLLLPARVGSQLPQPARARRENGPRRLRGIRCTVLPAGSSDPQRHPRVSERSAVRRR